MSRPRRAGVGAGVALGLFTVLPLSPAPSRAGPAEDGAVVAQTNGARATRRLPALTRSPDLDVVATRHAERLAATAGPPFHNPALTAETGGYQSVGEVVGRVTPGPGWDVRLLQLFLASATHRRVILSAAYTVIGTGTARATNGDLSVVEVLGRPAGVRATPPPQAARARPAPPAAPRRAASPSTVPPALPTTTTPPPPPPPPSVPTTAPPLPPPPTIASKVLAVGPLVGTPTPTPRGPKHLAVAVWTAVVVSAVRLRRRRRQVADPRRRRGADPATNRR